MWWKCPTNKNPDMRFWTSGFFHQTTPPRPLIHGMPFSIWISIRRENRLCNRRFSVTCLTPLWPALRCANMTPLWLLTYLCEALANFKGNIYRKNIHRPIVLHYTVPITFTYKKWGLTRDRFLSQQGHWLRCDKNRRSQSWFSRRILIHIEKCFNPCLRGLGGVVWWKKPEVENLVSGSL
jgi:hypothetical protein